MKAALPGLIALMLTAPAIAQERLDISGRYDPSYLWFDAPNTTDAGDARIRIVFAGREGAAALTPNQYWAYGQSYRRHLARLSFRQTVASAEPRARYAAFMDVLRAYPNLAVTGFDLDLTYDETAIPDW